MKKTSKKRKRTGSAVRKEDSAVRPTSNLSTETTPYRCTECRLFALPAGQPGPTEGLSEISQLREKPLWKRCPDEGPRKIDLWNPLDPSQQRLRRSFRAGKLWFRLCTRRVKRIDRLPTGEVVGASYHPACSFRRMLGEAFVQDRIADRGFAKRMVLDDLRHIFWGFQTEGSFPVTLSETIGWRMVPVDSTEAKSWVDEIPTWGVPLKIPDMSEVARAARALLTAATSGAQDSPGSRRVTLDVPFDMRFSLDKQWKKRMLVLQEIQDQLLALGKRKGVYNEPDYEVWKRCFKCHVLKKYGRLSHRLIAKLIKVDPRSGVSLVSKDLKRVDSVLKGA